MFEQDRMIGRLQRLVAEQTEIIACFLSGSFGRRAEDAYSDLDIALVYQNEAGLERAWHSRIQFAKSIMPYISLKSFDAEHIRPYFHIVLFANGSKLDLRFENKDTLQPNPWDAQIRILKDTDGWTENYQSQSGRLAVPQTGIGNRELVQIDQRFWVMYWDILRLLVRGDTEKSFPIYLQLLHFSIPTLIEVLPPGPERTSLFEAQFNRDRNVNTTHFRKLLKAYLRARQAIIQHHHLQFAADHSFENQIQRLVDKLI